MQNNLKIFSSPQKWFFSFNYNFQDINVTPLLQLLQMVAKNIMMKA